MIFQDNLNVYQRLLVKREQAIRKELDSLPKGTLFQKKIGKYKYYYVYHEGNERSIHKDSSLVARYEKKKLLEKQLEDIEIDLKVIEHFRKNYRVLSPEVLGLQQMQRIQGMPWDQVQDQQNSYWSDSRELIYCGIHYHSKSEMLIAMLLTGWGIEFKYEVTLKCGYRRLHPDFVIRRPRDGKIIYLEHAGSIHKEDYVVSLHERLDDYHAAGIHLWDNLILTFDREDGSIDMDSIEKVLRLYLLECA